MSRLGAALLCIAAASACTPARSAGDAAGTASASVGDADPLVTADRLSATAAIVDGAHLAPDLFARAEQLRQAAHRARDGGDGVGAGLFAEQALASYAYASSVVRVTKASLESADAQRSLDENKAHLQSLEASRVKLEDDAADLEKKLAALQMRVRTASSGAAPPERESARRVAAAALLEEARLLCDSAKLIAAEAEGLADAQAALAKVGQELGATKASAPTIDGAARCRADCLDVLARARRSSNRWETDADMLLTEISAMGTFAPSMDERGVVVTLAHAYEGTRLTPAATADLQALGRVAAAHPAFPLELVVYDAAPSPGEAAATKKLDTAVSELETAGAGTANLAKETMKPPPSVLDGTGAVGAAPAARGARLDLVFVAK